MNNLSNIFSTLRVDAEDDKEQIASLSVAKSEKRAENSDVTKTKNQFPRESTSTINDKLEQQMLPSPSGDYKMPLVWIDLEMTGLDIEVDRILEIACIITDGKLINSIDGPDFVIRQTKECLDKMGEWCCEHHASSGLTERVLRSTLTEADAENQVIDFVKKHVGSQTPQLAGNSIYVDFLFLKKYMPSLAAIFSHVLVDVSSIVALCIRWFPKEKKKAPKKAKSHRAMNDIKESIQELKYYKQAIFKASNNGKL
ncbi:oligoribonuclease-like [Zingiber officinale]|uniref:oligoribonuclease-like n=1 Tax=Zingiber officinale TaxID=94328 RepID=UPI001C4DC561|nr:oligoribonuclease-like [Zingiber officinale]